MESEIFVDKCDKTWSTSDWAYCCDSCSLQEFIVICFDCFDKSKHFGHNVQTIYCEEGVWCDCGDQDNMKSQGFCSKHSIENVKRFDINNHKSGLKSTNNSYSKSHHMSEHKLRESDGFIDGILHLMFSSKPPDLPEFYHLNKISKYSNDGNLILKYFDRSKANNLDIKVKKIYEITKMSAKFSNSHFENMKRMLLWFTINNKEANSLSKILTNGIIYENGKMGRGLYFRDRIDRFFKYEEKDFGLLLLCDVAVGSMYRMSQRKQFREIPYGFDSVKAVGKFTPEKSKSKTIGNNNNSSDWKDSSQ